MFVWFWPWYVLRPWTLLGFRFLVGGVFLFDLSLLIWLLGFLAFWLFGILAFGFWAFRLLVGYVALGGLLALAFRILCIPSSSPIGGVWLLRLLVGLCGFWCLWLFA